MDFDAAIADLARAGLEPDLLARLMTMVMHARDIVRDNLNVRDNALRDYERERKRRYRKTIVAQGKSTAKANDVAADLSRIVPDNVPERTESVLLSSSLTSSVQGVTKEGSKKEEVPRASKTKGTRFSEDAVLTVEFRHAAIDTGADPNDVDRYFAEFKDFWISLPGQRGVKVNWLATWRNRIRDRLERKNGQRPNGYGAAKTSRSTGQDAAILTGVGRIADRIRARGAAERREREVEGGEDSPGRHDPRLL